MTEDDRRKVYEALLTGLGETAQKQLCAQDKQHAWGPWVRYQVRHDVEELAPVYAPDTPIHDILVRIAAERECRCCGKKQYG